MRKTPLRRKTPLKNKTRLKSKSWIKSSSFLPSRDGKIAPYRGLKQKTKLKQRSKKRAEEESVYRKRAKEFLKENPWCKPCRDNIGFGRLNQRSPQPSTEVHHMGRRHGKWLLDERFWLPVCSHHHRYIEDHGDWAKKKGYLLTPEQKRLLR